MLISLENLQRDVSHGDEKGCVSRFVDAILASAGVPEAGMSADQLYWSLEPNDYHERADYHIAISDRVIVWL